LIDNHAASLPRDRNKVQSFFIFFPTALLSPSPDESALQERGTPKTEMRPTGGRLDPCS
jgi:hypothetical protein